MSGPAHDAAGAGAGRAAIYAPPAAAAINHLLRSASWARERLIPFAGKTVRFTLAPFSVTFTIRESGEVEDPIASRVGDTSAAHLATETGAEACHPQSAGCASNESARPRDAITEREAGGTGTEARCPQTAGCASNEFARPRDAITERAAGGTGAEARCPQTAGCASNESARPPDASFTLTPGVALRMLASDRNAWQDVQMSGDTALAREILYIAQNLRWDAEEDLSRVFGDIVAHRMMQAAGNFRRWQQQAANGIARSAAAYWTDERPLIAARHDVERFVREVDALRDDVARVEKRIEQLTTRGERR